MGSDRRWDEFYRNGCKERLRDLENRIGGTEFIHGPLRIVGIVLPMRAIDDELPTITKENCKEVNGVCVKYY